MKLAHRFKPHRTQLISRTRHGSELSTLRNLLSDELERPITEVSP